MNTGAVEGYAVPVTYKTHRALVFIPGFFDDVSCK
jgi:hypothetical protein